eukprot:TRINITY_DN649_c0_g8_i1.p1 TRINITY_DN649_c0_g8~~TRINITY_DN649_c0_g8_i1.p1  ORF type:complete len:213 (-),score=48.24 TRINITY_DN649_c0_g8_i1:140-778(-)
MAARSNQKKDFVAAKAFVKKRRLALNSYHALQRRTRKGIKSISTNDQPEGRLALVIRIRGVDNACPQTQRVLKKFLRLPQFLTASFVKLDKKTTLALKRVENYVTYGYPTRKTIMELLLKRGHCKVDGELKPLNTNELVERYLGGLGVICLEDIAHELLTDGPNFDAVNKFLCSFRLNKPKKGLGEKMTPFSAGGEWGNREEKLNELVLDMI